MAWGAVSPQVARVVAHGADGQSAEGQILPLPPSMSVGFSAFVVSMPDPADTTLVAYDSTGATIDEVPFKMTPTAADCPDPASLSMPPAPPIPAPTTENVQTWLQRALAAANTIQADCGDYSTVAPQTLARSSPRSAYDTSMKASAGIISVRDVAPDHVLFVSKDADGNAWCLADESATGSTDYGRVDAKSVGGCTGGWGAAPTSSFGDVVFRGRTNDCFWSLYAQVITGGAGGRLLTLTTREGELLEQLLVGTSANAPALQVRTFTCHEAQPAVLVSAWSRLAWPTSPGSPRPAPSMDFRTTAWSRASPVGSVSS